MAVAFQKLLFSVIIASAVVNTTFSKPVNGSTTDDCYGTDCYVDMDYYDNTRNTELLVNINRSISELPAVLSSMLEMQQSVLSSVVQMQQDLLQELINMKNLQDQTVHELKAQSVLSSMVEMQQESGPLRVCSNVPSTGKYTVSLSSPNYVGLASFPVICDMDTIPGGWLIFQRRFDGSVNFDRDWVDYENGFGSLDGEFWLGLKKLHVLTSNGNQWEFRVDLEDFDGNHTYALYNNFRVADGSSFYRLTIGSYMQGDSVYYDLNGMSFTTKDQDHDDQSVLNCGVYRRSGWWHNRCSDSNPNGLYLGANKHSHKGMTWNQWQQWHVLKKTELKIRPVIPFCVN
ncbi:ficolin-2-like [Amphiura filiformis]|uniref:ficolin-2-like n=1 Tax=Amphiura filiformis TaxID=82378 RepID=UPI003B20FCAE